MRILGLDPGLGTTGWGLIEADGNRLRHIANGQLKTDSAAELPRRLAHLADQLEALLIDHRPRAVRRPQLGVPGGYREVVVGIEPQVAQRMPADGDEWFVEPLPLSGPRAGQDAELDRHGVRCVAGGGFVTSAGRRSSTIRAALRYTT